MVSGVKPYFDQPYYVRFSIEGCELGLDPNAAKEGITRPLPIGMSKALWKLVKPY